MSRLQSNFTSLTSRAEPSVRRALLDLERRLRPTSWTGVTFAGNWADYGGTFQTVQYRKVGDEVQIRGMARHNNATRPTNNEVMFTLPTGHRPVAQELLVAVMQVGTTPDARRLSLQTNGDMQLDQNWIGTTDGWVSFTGSTNFSVTA